MAIGLVISFLSESARAKGSSSGSGGWKETKSSDVLAIMANVFFLLPFRIRSIERQFFRRWRMERDEIERRADDAF